MASQEKIRADFKRLVGENRLTHAYLFFGVAENERLRFARELAFALERGTWEREAQEAGPLLDACVIAQRDEQIGIDAVREWRHFLWQRPFRSARRMLIVEDASLLTLQAQHAVLKIVEEPPPAALIILVARDPDVLLGTLASRLQRIYWGGETSSAADKEMREAFRAFVAADYRGRAEFLKDLVGDPPRLTRFVHAAFVELGRDPIRNALTLRRFLSRWEAMNRYNTNKKLQLEAALADVKP